MNKNIFILMLGDEGGILLPPASLENAKPLILDNSDLSSFTALLNYAPDCPVHILADHRTQHLKLDKLPPLSFFDRQKLLSRRLAQAFPATSLCAAVTAPEHQVLLTALDETETLNFWRDKLSHHKNPYAGITLLPLALASLLHALLPHAKQDWRLLLIAHQTGGFRQIVTHHNHVVFTRLTPLLPPTTHVDYACQQLATDIQATRRYLGRLGIKRDVILPLVAILPPSLKEAFQSTPLESTKAIVLTPQEAAAHAGIVASIRPDENYGDLVSLFWAAQLSRLPSPLLSPQEKIKKRNYLIKKYGTNTALLLLILAALRFAFAGAELLSAYRQSVTLHQDIAALHQEFTSLQKNLAPPSEPIGRLRQAIEKKRFYTTRNETPEDFAAPLANILTGQAQITNLVWKKGEMILDILLLPQEDAFQLDPSSRAAIIERFDTLAHNMQNALHDYQVNITRYPFKAAPQETLTNKDAALPELLAQFLIRKNAP